MTQDTNVWLSKKINFPLRIVLSSKIIMLSFLKKFYTFKNSIHFIYAEPYQYFASSVMRGEQLSTIAKKFLSERVRFTSTDYQYQNCTLYLTQWAVYSLTDKDYQKLKSRNNILIFDTIDGSPPVSKIKYADIIIASSQTIYKNYKKVLPKALKIFLIDHHADPRIKLLDRSNRPSTLQVGYFGEHINTFI